MSDIEKKKKTKTKIDQNNEELSDNNIEDTEQMPGTDTDPAEDAAPEPEKSSVSESSESEDADSDFVIFTDSDDTSSEEQDTSPEAGEDTSPKAEEGASPEAGADVSPDAEQELSAEPEKEPDILDDLEFISAESVRDTSKMAEGTVIQDEGVSRKKTKRRSVDAGAAKKEKVQKAAKKNLHVIVIVVIVVIVAVCVLTWALRQRASKNAEANKEQPVSSQEYETDAYEEINELISSYYACYAAGDTDGIVQYAYPMSDTEKSYIQMYSAYVDSYENVVCYTKTGADDSSWIVSAAFDVKFTDVETAAPGMDFFYVRTSESGTVYIDNIYSPFNLLYQENALDQEIVQLIQTYEASDDVIALQAGVQTNYEQALEQDEALRTLVEGTLADAVSAWQSEYEAAQQQKAEEAAQQVEEETAAEEQAAAEAEAEAQAAAEAEAEAAASDTTETENKAWVYVTETVYIRESPDESSAVISSATAGSQIRQLAVTANGWSKVKDGDQVGYIKSEYISTEETTAASSAATLTEGTTIRLTASVNIRSSMSESSERVGLAYSGETVTVVMSYSEGWTKVTWNGKTGYIRTDILAGM
ncbi:MAG: SH3 domain-containing protein [Clostridiales bacterium]|nr:SH3 domain-containing protein [Clostridiales bacterium]